MYSLNQISVYVGGVNCSFKSAQTQEYFERLSDEANRHIDIFKNMIEDIGMDMNLNFALAMLNMAEIILNNKLDVNSKEKAEDLKPAQEQVGENKDIAIEQAAAEDLAAESSNAQDVKMTREALEQTQVIGQKNQANADSESLQVKQEATQDEKQVPQAIEDVQESSSNVIVDSNPSLEEFQNVKSNLDIMSLELNKKNLEIRALQEQIRYLEELIEQI